MPWWRTTSRKKCRPARSRWPSTSKVTMRRRTPRRHPHRPPESHMLKKLSALTVAIGISVTVHAVLLTVRLVDPEGFNRFFEDTPLEVILVNSRSADAPVKATAIAQANLSGGGEFATGRATSPLPSESFTEIGDAHQDSRKQIEELQEAQQQLLAQLRRELASLPPPDPKRDRGDPQERA